MFGFMMHARHADAPSRRQVLTVASQPRTPAAPLACKAASQSPYLHPHRPGALASLAIAGPCPGRLGPARRHPAAAAAPKQFWRWKRKKRRGGGIGRIHCKAAAQGLMVARGRRCGANSTATGRRHGQQQRLCSCRTQTHTQRQQHQLSVQSTGTGCSGSLWRA